MTSTWRKKEQFKTKSTPNTNTNETLSNIPMFDVLKNIPTLKEKEKEKKENVIEGFEWQGVDYYHHHSVFSLAYDYSKIKEMFEKIMGYLSYPIANFDLMLEKFIYDTLMTCFLIKLDNCDKNELEVKNSHKNNANKMFFWIDKNLTNKNPSEGFSLNEQPELRKTINSFKKNHPIFMKDDDVKMKVSRFYVNKLNNYQTKLHRTIHDDELFEFNNHFDNLLNDANTQKQILHLNIPSVFQSQFENTEFGYKKFYDSLARFKIDNTNDDIEYFEFYDKYFPIPTAITSQDSTRTMDVFNNALNYANDMLIPLTRNEFSNYCKNNDYKDILFLNDDPPNYKTNAIDPNYGFSVNITKNVTKTIQEYLKYAIKYFSFFIFSHDHVTIGFQEIEARVGTIYTNCLNRLEFLYYNTCGNYLDIFNIVIFNHIFFILIQHTVNDNVYNNITNKYVTIADYSATNNKILTKNIFETFIIGNNTRYAIMQSELIENVEIPIVALNPYLDLTQPTEISTSPQYLQDYIKDDNFIKNEEMDKFFTPISECEYHKQLTHKKANAAFLKYAKIIKNEIYRILMIPVLLYVVYNIYYMFFFIDYKDYTVPKLHDDDEDHSRKLEKCEFPMFPDWENYYHYYEKHNTDFILEYVFKPSKIIYTWLNTIKTFIRTIPVIGVINGIIPPYIYFFITIILFYYVLESYGNGFVNFYISFLKTLSVPFVKIVKVDSNIANLFNVEGNWLGYTEIATIITFLFFAFSIPKDIFGYKLQDIITGLTVCNGPDINAQTSTEKKSWVSWISSNTSIILIICKLIIFILYWILKFYITYMMIPFATSIAVIYVAYTLFFAVYNNATFGYSAKIELIDSIMYTQLYDADNDNENDSMHFVKYVFKSICWLIMVFIMEILSVYVLTTGLKNITNNITDTSDTSYAETIKIVLIPVYVLFLFLIGLWCVYKYKFKLPILEMSYISRSTTKPPTFDIVEEAIKNNENIENNEIKQYILELNGDKFVNKDKLFNDMKKYNKYKYFIDKRINIGSCKNTDDAIKYLNTFNCILGVLFGSDYINNKIITEEISETNHSKNTMDYIYELSNKLLETRKTYTENAEKKMTEYSDSMKLPNAENIANVTKNITNTFSNIANVGKNVGQELMKSHKSDLKNIKQFAYTKYSNIAK